MIILYFIRLPDTTPSVHVLLSPRCRPLSPAAAKLQLRVHFRQPNATRLSMLSLRLDVAPFSSNSRTTASCPAEDARNISSVRTYSDRFPKKWHINLVKLSPFSSMGLFNIVRLSRRFTASICTTLYCHFRGIGPIHWIYVQHPQNKSDYVVPALFLGPWLVSVIIK